VSPRVRTITWYAVAAVALAALWAWKTGYLWPEPSLDPNPLAYARGEAVFKGRCFHCHEAIPIAPRVARWTPEYAHDAIGHLPDLRPAMPPFKGSDQERADLAIYLSVLGASAAAAEGIEVEEGAGWQPPRWHPGDERPRAAPR
jgi:mono/diheme cytochrome c family protein